jgi:hypothetical protein
MTAQPLAHPADPAFIRNLPPGQTVLRPQPEPAAAPLLNIPDGPRPLYLIRVADGKVFHYDDHLAQDSGRFTPTNELPRQHLEEIQKARVLETERKAALNLLVAEQDARMQLNKKVYEKILADYNASQLAASTKPYDPEEQLRLDEAAVTGLGFKELVAYGESEFGVKIPGNEKQVREQVRLLQSARREDLAAAAKLKE